MSAVGSPEAFASAGQISQTFIPIAGTSVLVGGPNSVSGADATAGASITVRGTVSSNGITYPVFDLGAPAVSLAAKDVRGDGTLLVLPDGGEVRVTISTMSYTALGMWTYKPGSSLSGAYVGSINTGASTPPANVPSNGTAVYKGSGPAGGVIGTYWEPSPTGTVQGGSLRGNADITVNFSGNSFAGTFNNMTATPPGGVATPWNDVTFSGTLLKGSSSVGASGLTKASPPPAGAAAGFSSAASGLFQGRLNGPNAEEIGGGWTLSEPTSAGGKAAIGSFGAAR